MTIWHKRSGFWGSSTTAPLKVKTGGVWTTVQNAYIKDGGVWKLFHTADSSTVLISVTSIGDLETFPTNPTASLALNSNGTITTTGNTSSANANWYDPTTTGIGSNYWALLTINSGSSPNSGTAGSIVSLASGHTWTWSRTSNGTTSASCTLTIYSDSGGVTTVATDSFNVSVIRDV
jgi:hypothetical protein